MNRSWPIWADGQIITAIIGNKPVFSRWQTPPKCGPGPAIYRPPWSSPVTLTIRMPTAGSVRAVVTSSKIFLISGGELIEQSNEHVLLPFMSFPVLLPYRMRVSYSNRGVIPLDRLSFYCDLLRSQKSSLNKNWCKKTEFPIPEVLIIFIPDMVDRGIA
jgi:hypothetical protein